MKKLSQDELFNRINSINELDWRITWAFVKNKINEMIYSILIRQTQFILEKINSENFTSLIQSIEYNLKNCLNWNIKIILLDQNEPDEYLKVA